MRPEAGVNKIRSKGERNVEKRAVNLCGAGAEDGDAHGEKEGVFEGRVMWHEFVKKTEAEQEEMESKLAKRKEKERRRKAQKENVERKKELRRNTKANGGEDSDVE